MRIAYALGGIVFLVGMLFMLTRGLPLDRSYQADNGGGGGKDLPIAAKRELSRARDHMGNAYLAAAETQQALVRGRWEDGKTALDTTRKELAEVKQRVPQVQLGRVSELIQTATELDAMIDSRDPVAPLTARRLTHDAFQLYNAFAGMPPTDFADAPPASPLAPPMAADTPPPQQTTTTTAIPAQPAGLDAVLARAQTHAAGMEENLRNERYHRAWLEMDRLRAALNQAQAQATPEMDRRLAELDARARAVEQGRRTEMVEKTRAIAADLSTLRRQAATGGGGGGRIEAPRIAPQSLPNPPRPYEPRAKPQEKKVGIGQEWSR